MTPNNNFGNMCDTDRSDNTAWAENSQWPIGAVVGTTTYAFETPTVSSLYKEASLVLRRQSMQTNNYGLDHLIKGNLHEARDAFVEADRLNEIASYPYCGDDDGDEIFQEYQSNWVNLQALVGSIGQNNEMKQTMNHLFLYGLRIGDPIHMADNDSSSTAIGKPEILWTSRMDWSIRFNLSLVTQFLGIVTSNVVAMTYRADSFDRYDLLASDVVAWYNGRAPLDAAILMMAVRNNQGSMYCQLRVVHQVEKYWVRMGRILNASRSLQAHTLCKTFVQNLTSFMNEQRGSAPAA
eukprot:scaffold10270_cov125-Cylindrotheca_fusiformis.AAC.5